MSWLLRMSTLLLCTRKSVHTRAFFCKQGGRGRNSQKSDHYENVYPALVCTQLFAKKILTSQLYLWSLYIINLVVSWRLQEYLPCSYVHTANSTGEVEILKSQLITKFAIWHDYKSDFRKWEVLPVHTHPRATVVGAKESRAKAHMVILLPPVEINYVTRRNELCHVYCEGEGVTSEGTHDEITASCRNKLCHT